MAQLSGFKGGGGSGSRGVGGEARGSNARPGGRLGWLRIHDARSQQRTAQVRLRICGVRGVFKGVRFRGFRV